MAWDTFERKNGTASYDELIKYIKKYRNEDPFSSHIPQIGCIILTEPFFFERDDWIEVPKDWSNSIVSGKTYSTDTAIGNELYQKVLGKIKKIAIDERFSFGVAKHRLGQGGFRVSVVDAYKRSCAVTGEKTLPVLEAAHIKPFAKDGPHDVSNGLLLRSDLHTLFDSGYITIDKDYRVEESHRLHDDFGNGKDYYQFNGEKLLTLPEIKLDFPAREYLEWHNNNVFLG